MPASLDWDPDDTALMLQWTSADLRKKRESLAVSLRPIANAFNSFGSNSAFSIGNNAFLQEVARSKLLPVERLYLDRGWASVSWNFYGGILQFLEMSLNFATPLLTIVDRPVYAFGYDWRLSNQDTATKLSQFIDNVLAQNTGASQVVLVTHSMGGLVARAACLNSSVTSKIKGVVHTVLPSNGSVTAYRRFLTGCMSPFDHGPSNPLLPQRVTDTLFQNLMGATKEEYATLMSALPGPMELLPNHRYQLTALNPWLVGDPQPDLSKIYDVYRGPFVPGIISDSILIFLSSLGSGLDGALVTAALRSQIDAAQAFHEKLGDSAHPNTFVLFSTGLTSDESVDVRQQRVDVHQQAAGDGTVHEISAKCPGIRPEFVKGIVQFQGLEHSAVFADAAFNLAVVTFVNRILAGV